MHIKNVPESVLLPLSGTFQFAALFPEVLDQVEQLVQQRDDRPQDPLESLFDTVHDANSCDFGIGMLFVVDHEIKMRDGAVSDPVDQRVETDCFRGIRRFQLRVDLSLGQRVGDGPAFPGRSVEIINGDADKSEIFHPDLCDLTVMRAKNRDKIKKVIGVHRQAAVYAQHAVLISQHNVVDAGLRTGKGPFPV